LEFGVKEATQQNRWEFEQSGWDEEVYTQIEKYICSDGWSA
jgi:hypothetical protein